MSALNGIYDLRSNELQKGSINFSKGNGKFLDDNLYEEDDELLIVLEGCILNMNKLKNQHNIIDTLSMIKVLWSEYGEGITSQLKGAFTLVIYEKNKKYLFVTNDLLSKRPLYIFKSNKYFMFSSKYFDLVNLVKTKNESLSLNKLGVAMMLTKGYLGDSVTYANEISYLRPYQYLVVKDNKIRNCTNEIIEGPLLADENQIIKGLNEAFALAIQEQFQKNIEYGYEQLSTLSAGMDSRTCLLYANKMGYKDILCVSYSQSGSIDHLVSQKIAIDYDYEYLFYPLDQAKFLYIPQILCTQNECQQSYAGSTGAYQMVRFLDTTKYGIIHTGLLGGELLSDVFSSPEFTEVHKKSTVMEALPLWDSSVADAYKEIKSKYVSEEEYLLYENTRACQNFNRMVNYKYEAFSPFMHEDFFMFANRISPMLRYRRNIYRKWMVKCIPNDYVTTYFKTSVISSYTTEILSKVINKLTRKMMGKNKFDMNPMEYWAKTIPNLKGKIDEIYEVELVGVKNMPNDVEDTLKFAYNMGITGKIKAITVLRAMNNLYS